VERLRFRELDVVVTEKVLVDPDLVNLEQALVPVVLTCSGRWRIRSSTSGLKATAAVRELIGIQEPQWVLPSAKFRLRSEIDQYFEKNRLKGRIVFESDVVASLVRSVIDEIGLAFLPLLYVAREVRESSIRVLGPKEGYWKYRVWLVCHRQNRADALIQSVARSFKEICQGAVL
jgi:DNA-binding transcriptional LysR family regulator